MMGLLIKRDDIHPVRMAEIAKDITINIRLTGMKRFAVRMWIGVQIIRLAALILPTATEIEVGTQA
jgi:hypothetical protein